MIKRIVTALGLCSLLFSCTPIVRAEEINIIDELKKIPVNNGIFYNLNDSKIEYAITAKILSYRGINLNAGYTIKNTALLSVAYEIVNLEKLGVEIPVLKNIIIDTGWAVGYKKLFDNNEFVNGPSVTLKIKF